MVIHFVPNSVLKKLRLDLLHEIWVSQIYRRGKSSQAAIQPQSDRNVFICALRLNENIVNPA